MPPDPIERRLKRIELTLGILAGISVLQLAVLLGIAISFFLPNLFLVLSILALVGVFLYLYWPSLPGWFGSLSRSIFSQLKDLE
jgi:hypothetical protein